MSDPILIDLDEMHRPMVNSPVTELDGDINSTQVIIALVEILKAPTELPNTLVIGTGEDAETIRYTGISGGTVIGVTRGYQGEAREWPGGTPVARSLTDHDIRSLQDNVVSVSDTVISMDGDLDAHIDATAVHGATSAITNDRIVIRDGFGRARISQPDHNDDIANKTYVDQTINSEVDGFTDEAFVNNATDAARDDLAESLGFLDWDALREFAITEGNTIISGGYINTYLIEAEAIAANHIAAGAITVGKIADDAIENDKIKAGEITGIKLANGTITAEQIGANVITAGEIAANTITASQIASETITAGEIAADTITAAKMNVTDLTAISGKFTELECGGTDDYMHMYISSSKPRLDFVWDENVHLRIDERSVSFNKKGTTTQRGSINMGDPSTDLFKINVDEELWILVNTNEDARFKLWVTDSQCYMGADQNMSIDPDETLTIHGALDVQGALSKSSGTFKIAHPLDKENYDLYHGFVESPRYDLIYRGKVKLEKGSAVVDIDQASNMRSGTFAALTQNAEVVSLFNQSGYTAVKASEITGGSFTIYSEGYDDTVAWVVMAERADDFIVDEDPHTDSEGRLIPEKHLLPGERHYDEAMLEYAAHVRKLECDREAEIRASRSIESDQEFKRTVV